jgi:hypothetical protein
MRKLLHSLNVKNTLIAIGCISLLAIFIKVFSFAKNEKNVPYGDALSSSDRIFSLHLPKDLNFSGERVPFNDFSICEAVDREFLSNHYWRAHLILMAKRANRWFPIIEPILKKHGIPDDIKYVALAESHLTNSMSPRGAAGFWQLIEPTAKNYGLVINSEIDERYSIERSTEAACQYFKEAYKKFGNWTLSAASYNLGMGGIDLQLKKQKVNNYYDLYLNEETGRYIYRILAMKTILQNPAQNGIEIKKNELYSRIPTTSVRVDSSITNLVDFSISQGYTQ